MKHINLFGEFFMESAKFTNGWEFSVEEVTNILQDIIDSGVQLNIWEVKALVNGLDTAPICVTVIGPKLGLPVTLDHNKNVECNLSKNSKNIIERLKEFFKDIFYNGETHLGSIDLPNGTHSDDLYYYHCIYINDCVDEKYFSYNRRSNM